MWKVLHGVGVIRKPSKKISQNSFITICKSFVMLHLDYGDMLFGQPNKEGLWQKIESVQYNTSLVITGAIKGTSQIKPYNNYSFIIRIRIPPV